MILPFQYWYFLSAIPPQICDQIIEVGVSTLHEKKNKYGEQSIDATTGGWRQKQHGISNATPINELTIDDLKNTETDLEKAYVRDSHVVFLSNAELYDIVWPFIHAANKKAGWNFEWDYTEDFQFTRYGPGQFYGWHMDTGEKPYELYDPAIHGIHKNVDGTPYIDQYGETVPEDHNATTNPKLIGKIRKLSCTLSLNDPEEYEGGNLKFDFGPHVPDRFLTCTEIRPRGSIIVFPSHLYHQVTPVTKGIRYSLVSWHLGKPFR